ncbi:dihydrodipicolinate synthase family protein, partial [Candidatus Latescibacterota bacterium]
DNKKMKSIKEKLSGVFAPVVMPFKDDKLLLDDLRDNIRKLNETKLTGYLAHGSNGEFRSLNDEEQIKVLEVFAEEKGDKVVMVGTACESTTQTIDKTKQVADMGFDFASILTPCYFAKKMTDEVLIGYYTRIADNSPIPILLYNAPGFAGGVSVSPTAAKVLAGHENIVGMKDSSSVGPNGFLAKLDGIEDFHVMAGSANFFYPTLHIGTVGGIISLSNVLPEPCCDLYQLFIDGKYDEARTLHLKLQRLNGAVSGSHGVAGVKGAMDIAGFHGGEPRHPLIKITDADKQKIRESIISEGFTL